MPFSNVIDLSILLASYVARTGPEVRITVFKLRILVTSLFFTVDSTIFEHNVRELFSQASEIVCSDGPRDITFF
jgi:hypothetical protein